MNSDLTPAGVLAEVKNGNINPVYLFYGESEYLRERTLSSFLDCVIPKEQRKLSLQIFYADETKIDRVTEVLYSPSFFGGSRVIVIRRFDKYTTSDMEILALYVENPMPPNILILIADNIDFRKNFYKKLKDKKYTVQFKEPYDNEIPVWILNEARNMGIKMSINACNMLRDCVGNSLVDLYWELEKLKLRYKTDSIGIDEIKTTVNSGRGYNLFELVDSFGFKNIAEFLNIFRNYVRDEGESAGTMKAIGMILRQIYLLMRTRTLLDQGLSANEIYTRLGLKPFIGKKIIQQAEEWQIAELKKAIHATYRADGLIKTGLNPVQAVENMILQLLISKN